MEIDDTSTFLERFSIFISITAFFLLIFSLVSDYFITIKEVSPVKIYDFFLITFISLFYFLIFQNYFSSKSKGSNQIVFYILFNILVLFITIIGIHYFCIPIIIPSSLFLFFFYNRVFSTSYSHDDFEEQCQGKTGEQLGKYLYTDKFIGEGFLKNIKAERKFLLIIFMISFIFISSLSFVPFVFSKKTFVFMIFLIIGICIKYFLLTVFQKEAFYAFMGFEKQWIQRNMILFTGFSLIFISSLIGIIVTTSKPIINTDFLKYLFSLFNKPIKPTPPEPKISNFQMPELNGFDPEIAFGMIPESKPNKNLELVILILEILAAALLSAFILYLLIKPLTTEEFRELLKERRLKEFWKLFFENFKSILYKIFHFKFHKEFYSTTDSTEFQKNIDSFLKNSKKSKEKKMELDRLTKQFTKLISWGQKHQIQFKNNLAPAEYTDKIVENFNENSLEEMNQYPKLAGFLFEKALYSEKLLTQDEEIDYSNAILKIISVD